MYGLILAASIKAVAQSSPRPSIPCTDGMKRHRCATSTCQTLVLLRGETTTHIITWLRSSGVANGLHEAGLYKSFWLRGGSYFTILPGKILELKYLWNS
jgi:hypothetical protein